jgi:hypothetical protein
MSQYKQYQVGEIYPEFIMSECPAVSFDQNGLKLVISFHDPTEDETKQFFSSEPFELRYSLCGNLVIFLLKFGNLNWMDTSFCPFLVPDGMDYAEEIADGQGILTEIIFVNGKIGKLLNYRIVGLGTDISRKLIQEVKYIREKKKKEDYQASSAMYMSENASYWLKRSVSRFKV